MKICYLNCNGAFRKKYTELLKEKADLYIVSEVEDISKIDFLKNAKIFGIWAKGGYVEDLYTYSAINIEKNEKFYFDW